MTRVAYVCADPGVPVFGSKGASVHVQEVVRAFRRRDARVRVYCTRTDDLVPADLADLPVRLEPVGRPERSLPPRERTAAREAAQARAARVLAEQVVADGADLVYERYSLFSTALADATSALGVPGVLEVNAPLVEEQRTHRELVDVDGAHAALRTQVAAAASVACVSDPVAAWVTGRTGRRDGVVVVPNGVDPHRIRPVAGDPATTDRPAVVFVGTLKPWHGVDVLLEAAARARTPWRVRLVGDGPQGPALRAQAARLGLDVDFRGALAPADVPAALAGAAVAVAPYPRPGGTGPDGQYFSPLKVLEYAAAGLPTVASAVGQLPRLVLDGRTGLLVPPSDPGALAAAVDGLVTDPARARALGRAARRRAETVHSWEAVLDRTLAPLSTSTEHVA